MFARVFAWSAHAYTALGLVLAAAIAVSVVEGGDQAFRLAFLLMVVAAIIDTTDGWLARRARVRDVLPGFDGRRLDDLIDFQTYTCLPLLLLWRAGLFHDANQLWLLAPLVASAYGFCQVQAKTEDHYFLGFPSYWNVIALYLYLLGLPEAWSLAIILAFAVLTFVPTRYVYTTDGGRWSLVTNLFGTGWAVSLLVILWQWQRAPRWLVLASLSFPAYYLALSWMETATCAGAACRSRSGSAAARPGSSGAPCRSRRPAAP
jgi:phosphatidylcholine synthase